MAVFPKAMYRVNTISIKIPTASFIEMEIPILKFLWSEWQGTSNCKNNLQKKEQLGDSYFLVSKYTAKLQ